MLVNKVCPNCGTEQVGLNLKETNGSFVCYKCKRHFVVEGETIREIAEEQDKKDNQKWKITAMESSRYFLLKYSN